MKSSCPNLAKPSHLHSSADQEGYNHLPIEHWSLLRIQLLWIFDRPMLKTSLDYAYFPHPIAAWYLKKGSVTLSFPDGQESYSAGSWIFPRRQQGRQLFSPDTELISLRFYAEWQNGMPLFPRDKTVVIPDVVAPQLKTVAEALAAYARDSLTPSHYGGVMLKGALGAYFGLQPLVAQWINAWYQAFLSAGYEPNLLGPTSDTVQRCIEFLRNRPLHQPFREQELVEQARLSISQIHRLFIKHVKSTPKEFWDYRRTEFAQLALLGGKESIKSIAFSLGFQTPESFSRWFRGNVGYPPSDFRTRLH